MKYLKKFSTTSEYEVYKGGDNYLIPNVSLCVDNNEVHYNWYERKLIVYYNIQDNSSPTTICTNYDRSMVSMEVDGVQKDTVSTTYQFDSVGEHVIKYEFSDPTTIGNGAPLFSNVSALKRIEIPDNVVSIGNNAFYYCGGLESVNIPNSVTSIGAYAFYYCESLSSLTIGNSVESIGDSAFYGCRNVTSITIPNNVKSIGDYAFHNCYGLTNVTTGNGITNIGIDAFYNTPWWEPYSADTNNIYNDVVYISDVAYKATSQYSYGDLVLKEGTLGIGGYGFRSCDSLTSVTIPNTVVTIGSGAFDNCDNISSVTISSSVTLIVGNAFYWSNEIASVVVESGNAVYDSRNNCNAIIETATNTLKYGCKSSTIPNSVTTIGVGAFNNCDGLTSITIPDSVVTISNNAFQSCDELISITIPNSVVTIGNSAFNNCGNMTSVIIGSGVTTIEYNVFLFCSNLETIVCNARIAPSIGSNTFQGVKTNGILTVPQGSTGYDTWMGTGNYYLGKYNWTKVEQ